jgi:signal transduction histidine kinase
MGIPHFYGNSDGTLFLQNRLKYKVSIEKQFAHNIPVLKGNEGKLHQVFINLLSNAEQAIEKEGTIRITIEVGNSHVIVSIQDSGSGIRPEDFHKLRDPFYTTKPPGEGTGLGLYISYEIIEAHKGKIEFTSEVGVGTTFSISLPYR